MKTENLYEFLVLSKTLNYSKAAENLYISQSVLSKHIQEMEKELGTKLFSRSTHEVSLTQTGVLLAQKAAHLIEQYNIAARCVQTEEFTTTGEIHIACALELAYSAHIKVFISRFMEHYPDIQIFFQALSEGTPTEITHSTVYDFIFTPCEYLSPGPNIHMHLLRHHGTYVALPSGHRLSTKSLIHLRDLEGETIIVPFADELFGPYARNLLLAQKYTHEKVNSIKVPNLTTALFLVSLRKGIAIIPRYGKKFASEDIQFSGIANELCSFPEYLYYKEKPQNKAAKLFYEEFCDSFLAPVGK